MNYADYGTQVMLRRAYAQAAQQPIIGFTAPTILYDRMRALDPAVQELQTLVQTYVTRQAFKDSWSQYYGQWVAFYQKYLGSDANKLGAPVTDNAKFEAQIEDFRVRYQTYRDGYSKEVDANGQPLKAPAPISPLPPPPPPDTQPDDQKKSSWTLPWWAWMLGGVAVVGGGYWLYKRAIEVRDARRAIDKALPNTLGALVPGGHAMGTFVAEHSPARDPNPPKVISAGLAPDPEPHPAVAVSHFVRHQYAQDRVVANPYESE